MPRSQCRFALIILVVSAVSVTQLSSGPYSDEVGKCLVGATTTEEKEFLVKWIFSIAALHPSVSQISNVTDAQRTAFSKTTAALFESLLTDRCKAKVVDAVKYEGSGTIEAAFTVLGQAAMMEMFSNAEVAKGLQEYASYLDEAKFEQLLGPAAGNLP
jgi:hypothetical protein